jgi:hypothetical protein
MSPGHLANSPQTRADNNSAHTEGNVLEKYLVHLLSSTVMGQTEAHSDANGKNLLLQRFHVSPDSEDEA